MMLRGILKGCSCLTIIIFIIIITFSVAFLSKPSKYETSKEIIQYIYPLAYENLMFKLNNLYPTVSKYQITNKITINELELNAAIYKAMKEKLKIPIEHIFLILNKDIITVNILISPSILINLHNSNNQGKKNFKTNKINHNNEKNILEKSLTYIINIIKKTHITTSISSSIYLSIKNDKVNMNVLSTNIGLIPIPTNLKFIESQLSKTKYELNKYISGLKKEDIFTFKFKIIPQAILIEIIRKNLNKVPEGASFPFWNLLSKPYFIYSDAQRKEIEKIMKDYIKNKKVTHPHIIKAKKLLKEGDNSH